MLDYDRLAADYARHRQLHPPVLRSLLVKGRIDSCSRLLEVGFGTGNYLIALQEAFGCAAWGIDPSVEMLTKASERGASVMLGQGRAEELAFDDGLFDLVFSVDVIHHVGDRPAYFREACRVLKPGGRICTVTDSEWIIRHRRPLSEYFPATIEPELQRYPALGPLREEMEAAGFGEIVEEQAELAYRLTDSGPTATKLTLRCISSPRRTFGPGWRGWRKICGRGPSTASRGMCCSGGA